MRKFFSSISPTAWLLSATILAATALVCLAFKDYDRYAFHRFGTDNSLTGVIDKKTGVVYYPAGTFRDYPNGVFIRRKQKELEK